MEELELIVASVKQEMDAAIKHLDYAFQKIRAGRASTAMVQDVMVSTMVLRLLLIRLLTFLFRMQ